MQNMIFVPYSAVIDRILVFTYVHQMDIKFDDEIPLQEEAREARQQIT
jgi:hypothetical protein